MVSLNILDSAPESEFDALVRAAALVCGVPISAISLIDTDRQWFKAAVGLTGVSETSRELAFCAHTILEEGIFEVPDATLDERFLNNELVTGDPNIRFYAAATLRLSDGSHVGTLCVIDRQPRQLSTMQREVLAHLAIAAAQALEGRRALLVERGLHEASAQAAAVLTNSLDAIITLSLDGTIKHWNEAAERLFGYSSADMLGQPVAKLVQSHQRNEQDTLEIQLEGASAGVSYETNCMHCNGDAIAVSVSLAPIHNAQGRLIGATKIIRDIRTQMSAAIVLAESESRFRALSECSPLGVFATDSEGACTYTNDRWQAIYGLTLSQSLGKGWISTLHRDDRSAIFSEWRRTMADKVDFDMSFRILRTDGQTRTVHAQARAQQDAADFVKGYVGSVEDVTERKHQENALRKSEQLLNRTGEVAGVGGWELDLLTDALTWSAQTYRIHGVPIDYVPQLSEAISFYAPEARPAIQAAVEKAVVTGESWDLNLPFIQANGERIWVRAVGAVEFEDGRAIRLVGTFQDITTLHDLHTKLAEQHELIRVTLQSIGDAVITTDASGMVTWMNPVAERMTGWLSTEAAGRAVEQVFHLVNETTRERAENPVATCLQEGATAGLTNHAVLVSRTGDEFGIKDSASPIRNEHGALLGVVLVFHDVTEQRRLSNEMSYRASHDALTGLINRSEFEIRLKRVLRKVCKTLPQGADLA